MQRTLFQKLHRMLEAAKDRWPGLLFFALFRPEGENFGRWELVVSADELSNDLAGYDAVAEEMGKRLGVSERMLISRIVIVPPNDPGLRAFLDAKLLSHGEDLPQGYSLSHFVFGTTAVRRAHLFFIRHAPSKKRPLRRGSVRTATGLRKSKKPASI
jgi:hypothetical protein